MGLYLDNNYLNIQWIRERGMAFNFITGGRGIGKTYGALTNMLDTGAKFMFMRRTQTQIDEVTHDELSPFKRINNDRGIYIKSKPISKYTNGFYKTIKDENEVLVACGEPIGYTCALSTISNLRGFDASDCEVLIYDEFISEKHERPIKNEGQAFLNAYETINRNRELEGNKPLQVLALSNSNSLANPIFMELGIVKIVENMKKKGQEVYIDPERSLGIFYILNSKISEAKAKTALYKVSKYSTFSDMSLNNEFIYDDMSNIKSVNLKQYNPMVQVGELSIYQRKDDYQYYVCGHISGKPKVYGSSETERAKFKRNYLWLWNSYIDGRVLFEEYIYKALFEQYFITNY